jgi:ATP-dependent exoDNAse (exonuclease V) beta subunit
VHALLESADLSEPSRLGPLAAAYTAAHGCPERAADAEAAARRALGSETIRRAHARRVLRETPIAYVEGDVLVEGTIDLVYEEDDGSLVVVDFKTDAVAGPAEAAARAIDYRQQMALYAAGLERATGRTVREMVVLFLEIGVEIHMAHDAEARSWASDAIARAIPA